MQLTEVLTVVYDVCTLDKSIRARHRHSVHEYQSATRHGFHQPEVWAG